VLLESDHYFQADREQNLAYAEMRLILAKIIWSFDLELDPSSANWLADCKVFSLWKKPALNVHVKEVPRG